jgi:23S rRNA pseudouridine1911/1915/1917 synthase
VDSFITEQMDNLSRTRTQHLIRSGEIRVDHHSVKPSFLLQGGERIDIDIPPVDEISPKPESIPLSILYEDSDVVVVDKPAGLVVHPGAGIQSGTLVNALLYHFVQLSGAGGIDRPGIVHRLDRLTSGCLCVARNDLAHQRLSAQLAERTMTRTYQAWILGEMRERAGRIEAPIGRSPAHRTRMAVVRHGGRDAATRWRVLSRAPGLTKLELNLETGRTHQIRVHMAHAGYPVVGDPEYGPDSRTCRMRIPPGHSSIIRALSRLERQMLHASHIRFVHPSTGQEMEFDSPIPEDFALFESALGIS